MAITRSFGGQTLLKPGAYSVSRVDNAQSLSVGDNDTIMLIGEATNGTSSNSVNGEGTSRVFNSANVQSLVDYYVSGDIVDAALAAVRPSITAGVSGPGQFVVYKTNVGRRATQVIRFISIASGDGGPPVAGDLVRFSVPVNASGESADVDLIWGQNIPLLNADGSTPDLNQFTGLLTDAINASPALQNFFTAEQQIVGGLSSGTIGLTAVKQGPQFNSIRIFLLRANGTVPGWTIDGFPLAGLTFGQNASLSPTDGFIIQLGTPGLGDTTASQLNESFADAFNFDPNVIVPLWSNAEFSPVGTASATVDFSASTVTIAMQSAVVNLTNEAGASGAVTLSFTTIAATATDYADKFIEQWNMSMNARLAEYTATAAVGIVTITAKSAGTSFNLDALTVEGSLAGIDEVIASTDAVLTPIASGNPNAGTAFEFINATLAATQLQSHLIQRSSTSVRKEAQGMIGGRFADWTDSFSNSVTGFGGITSFLIQAFIQDVRVINSLGALEWKAPHILAAMAAGIRLGTTVGEPLTFKFVNANNVAHHVNTSTGNFSGSVQFKPGFDFNVAIQNGITFTELASGGSRIVVDNTRYVTDDSFIFNRGSVIEAAQFVAKSSRQLLERIFVGNKVSNGAALSLKNVLRNYLIELNADNIITSSSDAPFGFVEESFTVSINGNTADIQVEIKPVQGLDFIFINFTLGNITQQA